MWMMAILLLMTGALAVGFACGVAVAILVGLAIFRAMEDEADEWRDPVIRPVQRAYGGAEALSTGPSNPVAGLKPLLQLVKD